MKIVTAAQMQALDRRTITEAGIPGTVLMERAGEGVVTVMEQRFGALRGKDITILCGKGNNGGDGLVVARLLRRRQARVLVLLMAPASDLSRDAATMYRKLLRTTGKSAVLPFRYDDRRVTRLSESDIVVDALLGTGLSAEVADSYRAAIEAMNVSGRPIVAVDLPSGIHADRGSVLGTAVRASCTVTFGLPKLGCYVGAGIDHAGHIHIADIGIPPSYVDAVESRTLLTTDDMVAKALPSRPASSHKGTFGHAGIIAGSVGKTGAAAMAAQAALRVGTGLVTVATPQSVNDVLEGKLLEAMTLALPETSERTLAQAGFDQIHAFMQARSAVAIGPGLSTHPETVDLVRSIIRHLDRPSVLDADALNALSGHAALLKECKTAPVLTPHPGEMSRLVPDMTTQSVNADRLGTARDFTREYGCTLVLKGARTVIARPDGLVALCPTGNPGMATAGTGDALTGMTVGLLAQGLPFWEAAYSATYLHGLAGDLAAEQVGQAGMLAGDLISHIPHAIRLVQKN